MAKQPMTFENNFEFMREAVQSAPLNVMKEIGKQITKETRNKLDKRTGRLKRSVGYWARKKEKDLIVGYYNNYLDGKRWAAFYKEAVIEANNPLVDVVRNNKEYITALIGEALNSIGYKDKSYIEQMIGSLKDEQGE